MSQERDEELLRDEFRRLREETRASGAIPEFSSMMAKARAGAAAPRLDVTDGGAGGGRGRPSRRALVVGGWASVALAAAVAGILLVDRGPDADEEFARLVSAYSADAAAGSWRSPTDGLLDVPGMGLTRSMPSVGMPLRGLDPATRPRSPDGSDS